MAALRHDRITTPWFIEGPINGEVFLLYVKKALLPTLRQGDIVIMDNLGSQKALLKLELLRRSCGRFIDNFGHGSDDGSYTGAEESTMLMSVLTLGPLLVAPERLWV
jgi:hypothetical protein